MSFKIGEDGFFSGAVTFLGSVIFPSETITNAMVKSNAAIDATVGTGTLASGVFADLKLYEDAI